MTTSRRMLSLALSLLALGVNTGPVAHPGQVIVPKRPRPEPARSASRSERLRAAAGKPHQGARECARRRGSWDWLDYRVADRVRRGLPGVPAGEG